MLQYTGISTHCANLQTRSEWFVHDLEFVCIFSIVYSKSIPRNLPERLKQNIVFYNITQSLKSLCFHFYNELYNKDVMAGRREFNEAVLEAVLKIGSLE